jgi:hypothetical protein
VVVEVVGILPLTAALKASNSYIVQGLALLQGVVVITLTCSSSYNSYRVSII